MDRFKFKIVVYERNYEPKTDWKFAEIMKDNNNWHLTMCGDIKSNNCYPAHYRRDNAPDNVCRVYEPIFCTGLKDKNGKLIYEGDILKGKKSNNSYSLSSKMIDKIGIVEIPKGMFVACCRDIKDNCTLFCQREWNQTEIIGNIYENSDLIKELKNV